MGRLKKRHIIIAFLSLVFVSLISLPFIINSSKYSSAKKFAEEKNFGLSLHDYEPEWVADDENASLALDYVEQLSLQTFTQPGNRSFNNDIPTVYPNNQYDMPDPVTYSSTEIKEFEDYLNKYFSVTSNIDEIYTRSKAYYLADYQTTTPHAMRVPNYLPRQNLMKLQHIRSHISATEKDWDEAYRHLTNGFKLNRFVFEEHPALIGTLIGYVGVRYSTNTFRDLIFQHEPTEKQLDAILSELESYRLDEWTKRSVSMEFANTVKTWDNFLQGRIESLHDLIHEPERPYPKLDTVAARTVMRWKILEEIAITLRTGIQLSELVEPPFAETHYQIEEINQSTKDYLYIKVINPINLYTRKHITKAHLDFVKITIALLKYRKQYGEYPNELSEIRDIYGNELPLDPFSGKDYIYVPGKKLYSIGNDLIDDGGHPVPPPDQRIESGDIVWLLP